MKRMRCRMNRTTSVRIEATRGNHHTRPAAAATDDPYSFTTKRRMRIRPVVDMQHIGTGCQTCGWSTLHERTPAGCSTVCTGRPVAS